MTATPTDTHEPSHGLTSHIRERPDRLAHVEGFDQKGFLAGSGPRRFRGDPGSRGGE